MKYTDIMITDARLSLEDLQAIVAAYNFFEGFEKMALYMVEKDPEYADFHTEIVKHKTELLAIVTRRNKELS